MRRVSFLQGLVGEGRFELPASWSQTKRSNLAELHPDANDGIDATVSPSSARRPD